ncbi:D-alanyl-D-alanine carboxypeptidase DacB precursor [Posidoniimonas polymericola]|uniref:beta-lactamase n=1 Tax=Posidoniimonas polymericola TaxID=2528002 RepID=A0A5C5YTU3_9BACT|nr:serine hydrolase [Posidoniimonas polymericola]TWT78432.1 D-alanyl-D-alanine carboxypeptidase DacB precursor [Posidoniimonas polymericola]
MKASLRAAILPVAAAMLLLSRGQAAAADFNSSLVDLLESHRGTVSAAAKHLPSGEEFSFQADRPMPTASLIKLPILATAYHAAAEGKVDLDAMVTLKEEDKVPGSGVLTANFSAGLKMPLHDAIRLMIAFSDNTATNLVIDQIGLPATNEYMDQLGLNNTRLHAKVFRRDTSIAPERSREFGLGSTSASEMLKLLEQIERGELISKQASKSIYEHLLACESRSKVPRYLPEETRVAHKTGSVSAVRCDAGIIESPKGPIAFCILTGDNEDHSWGDENEAELLAAEFGKAIYAHWGLDEDAATAVVARVLKVGADGELVESLQRMLNARLKPSPDLGVDGDFGPNTERAVIKFQKQAGVEATGEVGPDTWRALGPLLTEDQPTPDPAVVMSKVRKKRAADKLTGPPVVTCKAYAIADAKIGEVLWGYNDSLQRDPASVTKIMTAYLVCQLAEEDPAVLEEVLTFSERADNTSGSTSDLNAGERVKVGDALYGLMLPSGNDMSVALAEHFGKRLAEDEGTAPYDAFIAAMNQAAADLGMSGTGYRNPHGLTADGHHTTAADMVKLARAALALPKFREVVKTPLYAITVDSVDGYQRNVVWKNTDQLLGIEGFYGVKTGTTGPAGACLVSAGKRGDSDLIVVVLGSTSGDARYVDARNLYRWAWAQLLAE